MSEKAHKQAHQPPMSAPQAPPIDEHRLVQERIRKLNELRAEGINPYPYSFNQTHHAAKIHETFDAKLQPEEQTTEQVAVAGRIRSIRSMGKVSFMHLQDGSGQIQLFLRQDDLPHYDRIKKLDIGDILGVHGHIFKTKLGETSVYVKEFTLLTKSLRPLPEKYHGLQDTELRYRQRYLDLIMNPEVKKVFELRSKIIREIRNYLDSEGFLEVETPILQPLYGGASARPFVTHHNTLNMQLYLKISPELYLKRLLVGGFEKVYDMNKNFRNEGIDRNHNPEFSMIEWYEAYTDYHKQMERFETLVSSIAQKVLGTMKITYQGTVIDLTPPWKRISVIDAIKEYGHVDVRKMSDDELGQLVEKHKLKIAGEVSRGAMIQVLFEELVEKQLIQPTFIMDAPKEVSPLTKVHRKDPALVERFEPYICGMEVGNSYSELNDPQDQKARLEAQVRSRALGDDEAPPMDEDFVQAIEFGMPPTGGTGLGVDRIIMILTDQPSIRDVILFPTMKPQQ